MLRKRGMKSRVRKDAKGEQSYRTERTDKDTVRQDGTVMCSSIYSMDCVCLAARHQMNGSPESPTRRTEQVVVRTKCY